MSPSKAFSMLKGTLERWDSVDTVLFTDLATEPVDWYPAAEPPPTESSASENSWSLLLQMVLDEENFFLAAGVLLLLGLLSLRDKVAGRGGLSGDKTDGDPTVSVFFD